MFGRKLVNNMITRSAENATDRRRFLAGAGAMGLGAVGGGLLAGQAGAAPSAPSAPGLTSADIGATAADARAVAAAAPSDGAVLNFALNLEYLEAEFYLNAVGSVGLPDKLTTGTGTRGGVTGGGNSVPFETPAIRAYAKEIASDEKAHVEFLRKALGKAAVSRPKIDLTGAFTGAMRAAGVIGMDQTWDPFLNENNFLLSAFLFEDVGVTAYKGAAPLINNKAYLEAAAGILAVEAYHAATIRSSLYNKGLSGPVKKISDARDSLDGGLVTDEGITKNGNANIQPTNNYGIAYSRTPGRVLNIVYLNPGKVKKGGFYPNGVNGAVSMSG